MTLREEVARRLCHAENANPRYPHVTYDMDWELYLRAADEAIRFAEWARRSSHQDNQEGWNALTLPPDDFKP